MQSIQRHSSCLETMWQVLYKSFEILHRFFAQQKKNWTSLRTHLAVPRPIIIWSKMISSSKANDLLHKPDNGSVVCMRHQSAWWRVGSWNVGMRYNGNQISKQIRKNNISSILCLRQQLTVGEIWCPTHAVLQRDDFCGLWTGQNYVMGRRPQP